MGSSNNGQVTNSSWKDWRADALGRLRLEDVYGDVLTGSSQGNGWLEARDPNSPSGDRTPSAGVADGASDYPRGTFHSFRDARHSSVFDYLVERGKASDFHVALELVANLTGVPLPAGTKPQRSAKHGQAADQAKTPEPIDLKVIDSAAFAAASYPLVWLIRQLLIMGQPCIVGGPKKCLKTSLLCDLVISIGAALPFLDRFIVGEVTRIGFLSGESGPHTIQDTARNVCKSKGISLAEANVWWGFALPQLSQIEHLARLLPILTSQDAGARPCSTSCRNGRASFAKAA